MRGFREGKKGEIEQSDRRRKKDGGERSSLFAAYACFLFRLFTTPRTTSRDRPPSPRMERGNAKKARACRTKGRSRPFSPLSCFPTKQIKKKTDKKLLTFKTSCSNVDSSTSSTALTARPDERADASERAGFRDAAGKAVGLRWEGRARPNAAVVEEHRAGEDSDALEEAGLAVAARPVVAVAFIDAIMVASAFASFLSKQRAAQESACLRRESEAK